MKNPGGRPRAEIDLVELEKLAALQCTLDEIAAWFDVTVITIKRRMRNQAFRDIVERGQAKGRVSLRRRQMVAAEAGNPTMLVWLGKQLLGQRDNIDTVLSGPHGTPIAVDISPRELLLARIAGVAARGSTQVGPGGPQRSPDSGD